MSATISPEAGFRLRSSEVIPLTHDLAEKFREMTASPTERDLAAGRVKHLREKILAGTAVTFHWVSAMLNDLELRMNGNHSSNALCSLNGSFPEGLMVNREVYDVSDEAGLATLFRQFDDRKSGRSPLDVSGAYQGLYEPLHDVPRGVAKLGIESIVWYVRYVLGGPTPKGDDVYARFAEPIYHSALRWFGDTITMKTPEMARIPVCAAMHATFEVNEAAAREFWSSVARGGVEFDETSPTTVLDAWLKDQKDSACKKVVKPLELYQGCIYAWTAFRQEEPLKVIKWDTKKGIHEIVR